MPLRFSAFDPRKVDLRIRWMRSVRRCRHSSLCTRVDVRAQQSSSPVRSTRERVSKTPDLADPPSSAHRDCPERRPELASRPAAAKWIRRESIRSSSASGIYHRNEQETLRSCLWLCGLMCHDKHIAVKRTRPVEEVERQAEYVEY